MVADGLLASDDIRSIAAGRKGSEAAKPLADAGRSALRHVVGAPFLRGYDFLPSDTAFGCNFTVRRPTMTIGKGVVAYRRST